MCVHGHCPALLWPGWDVGSWSDVSTWDPVSPEQTLSVHVPTMSGDICQDQVRGCYGPPPAAVERPRAGAGGLPSRGAGAQAPPCVHSMHQRQMALPGCDPGGSGSRPASPGTHPLPSVVVSLVKQMDVTGPWVSHCPRRSCCCQLPTWGQLQRLRLDLPIAVAKEVTSTCKRVCSTCRSWA